MQAKVNEFLANALGEWWVADDGRLGGGQLRLPGVALGRCYKRQLPQTINLARQMRKSGSQDNSLPAKAKACKDSGKATAWPEILLKRKLDISVISIIAHTYI